MRCIGWNVLCTVVVGTAFFCRAFEVDASLLEEDDACDAIDSCSLELRQLRAAAKVGGSASMPPPSKADDDNVAADGASGGLPGGWGEAAEYEREQEVSATMGASSDVATMGSSSDLKPAAASSFAACFLYGCSDAYVKGRWCQCNSGCVRYGTCCWDYYSTCAWYKPTPAPRQRPTPAPWQTAPTPALPWQPAPTPAPWTPSPSASNIKTLYHATSPAAGPLILRDGFRPGTQGWCGGGIYFAETVEATKTKAIGPNSAQGFLIEATVNVGVVKYMGKECNRQLTGQQVAAEGYDSVSFDPGDGREWAVYQKDKILSVKQYLR